MGLACGDLARIFYLVVARDAARRGETTMTSTETTYSIVSAGQHESLLDTRRSRHGHETLDAAVAALARATRHSDLVTVEIDGADEDLAPCAEWLVYADQEDADADDDGSSAIAIIRRIRPRVSR
jgi:hypothetical protein